MLIPSSRTLPFLSKFRKTSSSSLMDSFFDLDQPLSKEELDAIVAAVDSASSSSSSIKRTRHSTEENVHAHVNANANVHVQPKVRRLPGWGTGKPSDSRHGFSNSGRINSLVRCPSTFSGSSSCPRNQFLNRRYYSNQVNGKVRYPKMEFEGRIVYCNTRSEVEKASIEFMETIEVQKRSTDKVVIGFDIEWKPVYKKGAPRPKTAVMQICAGVGLCCVMHVYHSGIPPSLQLLLEDPTTVKVGAAIAGDACRVYKDYNVCVKALEDLSKLTNSKHGVETKTWGLCSLAEKFTGKQILKPYRLRCGNWEANPLSNDQLKYAATDAFASWHLYQVISSLPDAVNNQCLQEVNGVKPE